MTISLHEFIRGFLMHVLPKGLHRIRHFGLFAKSERASSVGGTSSPSAEPCQLTRPIMRRGTGPHANEARRQRRETLHHLTAAKLLPHDDPLGRVDAMDLKHVLGDIQTDCGNLRMWFVATITLRRFVAGSGHRPPHQKLP